MSTISLDLLSQDKTYFEGFWSVVQSTFIVAVVVIGKILCRYR